MGPSFGDILLAMLPILLLIAAWYFFMRKIGGGAYGQLMQRQVDALERIATALEKRS
ncbi:MAG: hypothetical protein NT015_10960 [Alphaproteobacteria bacterium]|nr:hypothetical protein [Alphaproteobacteria bacterium]